MQQAHVMHKRICTLLLSAHESLQQSLALYLSKLQGANFNLGVCIDASLWWAAVLHYWVNSLLIFICIWLVWLSVKGYGVIRL